MSPSANSSEPILAVDVDGVISLFGFTGDPQDAPCKFKLIDGMAHCIMLEAGDRLRRLASHYELVWASGWEDRANEHLPELLGLPLLPTLHFGPDATFGTAHWKLDALSDVGQGRPLAWIDDSMDERCHQWARLRAEPTLLVQTDSERGIQDGHVDALIAWKQRDFSPE